MSNDQPKSASVSAGDTPPAVEQAEPVAWGVADAGWPSLHDNEQDAIDAAAEEGGNAYVVPLYRTHPPATERAPFAKGTFVTEQAHETVARFENERLREALEHIRAICLGAHPSEEIRTDIIGLVTTALGTQEPSE